MFGPYLFMWKDGFIDEHYTLPGYGIWYLARSSREDYVRHEDNPSAGSGISKFKMIRKSDGKLAFVEV